MPIRSNCIVAIDDSGNFTKQGNGTSLETVRIAFAVVTFVMRSYHLDYFILDAVDRFNNFQTMFDMCLDQFEFDLVESIWIVYQLFGQLCLADIKQ